MILSKKTELSTKKRKFLCKDVRTIPGQSQNIREMVARMQRGQYVDVQASNYSLNSSFNDYSRLDKVDKIQYARDHKAKVETIRNDLKAKYEQRKNQVNTPPTPEGSNQPE